MINLKKTEKNQETEQFEVNDKEFNWNKTKSRNL